MSTQTIPTSPKPAFAPGRRAQFKVIQPQTTYTGSPITPLQKGLPRTTQSLCPECSELIEAPAKAKIAPNVTTFALVERR